MDKSRTIPEFGSLANTQTSLGSDAMAMPFQKDLAYLLGSQAQARLCNLSATLGNASGL
jgi:hypothetical protein